MRYVLVLTLGLLLPSSMTGQSRVTTLVGMGNSFGGLGVQADIQMFGQGPVSLMLAVGSTQAAVFNDRGLPNPWTDESVAPVAGALGLHAGFGRGGHQPFLELAVLPVAADIVRITEARQRHQMLYGLGLQAGYRARITNGLSLNAMGGAGYALNQDVVASRWKPVWGFGLGYAWPRH